MAHAFWRDYLTSGNKQMSEELVARLKFTNAFSLVGLLSLLTYGFINALNGNYAVGIIESTLGVLGVINVLVLRRFAKVDFSATVLLCIMLVVLGTLGWTGGIARTGPFWFFTFPLLAFILKGRIAGWYWMTYLFVITLTIVLLQFFQARTPLYTLISVLQFLVSLCVVSLLTYFFESIYEERLTDDIHRASAIEEANRQLQSEIDQRSIAEINLKKQNTFLDSIKTATLNILEDLKHEKEKTEETVAKNEALLTSIGEGMFAIDTDGVTMAMNKKAGQLLGLTSNQAIGKKCDTLWIILDENNNPLASHDRPLHQTLLTKKPFASGHYTYQRRDGTSFPVFLTITPVFQNRQLVGAIEVFRDITEERTVDRAKTEFVSLASHQLRTPLTAVNWTLEMLLSLPDKLTKRQKKYMEQVYESSQRMTRLVEALLNVSRIDLGKLAIQPTPLRLPEIVQSLLTELALSIESKHLVIKEKYEKNLPAIPADPNLMRIVLQNLLTNAIKYTPDEGIIKITIGQEKKKILIAVADTGYGIPAKQQSKIFTKLFRADNVRLLETDGTGLGLYTVKAVIEQSGGKIWFKSQENKGTTFYVTLPLQGMTKKEGVRGLI